MKDFTDVTSFFDEFEKAVNELKAAGGKISEQEKLRYMLKALPPSHSYIGDLIDVLPEKDRTVDYLKSKIKIKSLEEKNIKEQSDQPNSNVFSTDMRGKCFTCGKPGHKQIECQRGSSQGRGRGHWRGQHRGNNHYNQRDNNRGYQCGGYSRGRGSNRGTSSSAWN